MTIRVLFTLAMYHGWSIRQVDINSIFLHGDLTNSVYMKQHVGFLVSRAFPDGLSSLQNLLWFKTGPRAHNEKFSSFLHSLGFFTSRVDSSLLVRTSSTSCCYILVYVDDIIIMGNSNHTINHLISTMDDKFSHKDLGTLSYVLGIEVSCPISGGMFLSQSKYIYDMLHCIKMAEAKPLVLSWLVGHYSLCWVLCPKFDGL